MRSTLVVLALVASSIASAQQKKPAPKGEEEQINFQKVENEAGTDWKAWRKHMGEQLDKVDWTDSMIANMPTDGYTVEVKFIIDKYGRITEVFATKDPGFGLAAQAVKMIKSYPGKWNPAIQCGRNVNAYRKEKIIFLYVK
jgi:periplasmic protein TonB